MNKAKVLLVEDLPLARIPAKLVLSKLNCEVEVAENGMQALELVNKNRYDVILLDIGLPDIDGIAVTLKIRQDPTCINTKTPIIALTAHQEDEYKNKCYEAGVNDFMTKPLTEEKGREIIENYIQKNK
jgi:CheY-like chemotaxis protein